MIITKTFVTLMSFVGPGLQWLENWLCGRHVSVSVSAAWCIDSGRRPHKECLVAADHHGQLQCFQQLSNPYYQCLTSLLVITPRSDHL